LNLKSGAKTDPWALFLSPAEFGDASLRRKAEQKLRDRKPTLQGSFGNLVFENIKRYQPDKYRAALAAQDEFAKVASFFPHYKKIQEAISSVHIGLAGHGVGHLVYSMDKRSFTNLVEDAGIRKKVAEMLGEAVLEVVFDIKSIGILGLGLQMLELARGLENERMLGASGPAAEKWRSQKRFQFVLAVMAEDIRRRQGGDPVGIANELAARYARFQPLFHKYTTYTILEDNLRRYEGKLPARIPPSINQAPPR
jgi:hypothetical protein